MSDSQTTTLPVTKWSALARVIWHRSDLLIALLIFLLILIQNLFIPLSYDDYGYASLSYKISNDDAALLDIGGHDHTLADMLHYTYLHYQRWGGRVVCIMFTLLFLATPLPLLCFQIIQSLIVLAFLIYLARISRTPAHYLNIKILVAAAACYFLIPLTVVNDSSMWITASFGYLWLTVAAIILIDLFHRLSTTTTTLKSWGWALLYGLVGCSNELLGLAYCTTLTALFIFGWLTTRQLCIQKLLRLMGAISGYTILLAAPGNYARLGAIGKFADHSILEIITHRIHGVAKTFLMPESFPLMVFLLLGLLALAYQQRNSRALSVPLNRALPGIMLGLNAVYWLLATHVLDQYPFMPLVKFPLLVLLTITTLYLLAVETLQTKDCLLLALALGIIAYHLGRLLTPNDVHRIIFPLYLLVMYFLTHLIKRSEFQLPYSFLTASIILALTNYFYITNGYSSNYPLHQTNTQRLIAAAERLKNGKHVKKIILKKFNAAFYPSTPWVGLHEEENWIKYYYGIPQAIEIRYFGRDIAPYEKL